VVHTLELAQALRIEGHDVTIFAPASDTESMFRKSPCRIVLARVADPQAGTVGMVDARIRALKAALLNHGPDGFDVLHAQDSISGNALAELKQSGAIRGFVRTVHHLDHFDHPQLANWQRRAWQDADAVLCVSDTWTRAMRDTHGVNAQTVPNGVDVSRYRPITAPDTTAALRARLGIAGSPVILAVGGIEARKNTLMLLDAFAILRNSRPNAQLVIAGGASLLDHDDYARQFVVRSDELALPIGPGEPIVVTGPLEDDTMPVIFNCADVVSMISAREGFGLVVLEALACGKPVVVSRIAPFTEYLDDRTCVWADATRADLTAQALLEAIDDDGGGIDFTNAVPALLNRFNWAASARRHLEIYQQWLASQPPALNQGTDMPVMHFKIRWPDGIEASCYSPSTVVGEFFVAGERYPVDDFVARAREALNIGSERVREKYGFACSAALDQLAQIEAAATRFQGQPDAQVTLLELAE